jgi:hypothetical protein
MYGLQGFRTQVPMTFVRCSIPRCPYLDSMFCQWVIISKGFYLDGFLPRWYASSMACCLERWSKPKLISIMMFVIILLVIHSGKGRPVPHCWGTSLPFGIHIRRSGYNPPRGPSAGWWVLTTAHAARTNGLTYLPKHGGARDNKFFGHCLTNVA